MCSEHRHHSMFINQHDWESAHDYLKKEKNLQFDLL